MVRMGDLVRGEGWKSWESQKRSELGWQLPAAGSNETAGNAGLVCRSALFMGAWEREWPQLAHFILTLLYCTTAHLSSCR